MSDEAAPAPRRVPRAAPSGELVALLAFLALVVLGFSLATPRFLTGANLRSMAFQLPELGLLTLAMLVPILSGGLNLAVTYTANAAGLAFAAIVLALGGPEAGALAVALAMAAALGAGLVAGAATGGIVARHRRAPDPGEPVDDDLPARPRESSSPAAATSPAFPR